MKAIILGGGSVGAQVTKELIREGNDVVLIEKNTDAAQHLASTLDCMVVADDGRNLNTLKRIGSASADFFIALTGSDEVNLIASGLVAQQFPRAIKIARVRNPSYTSFLEMKEVSFAPVDHVVNPERATARSVVHAIEHGAAGEVVAVGNQSLNLQPLYVSEPSSLAGRSVSEIRQMYEGEFLMPLVLRELEIIIPAGDTRILTGDSVYFLGRPDTLGGLFRRLGQEQEEIRRIALFGGGQITTHVIDELAENRSGRRGFIGALLRLLKPRMPGDMVVFEQNVEKCKALAERFPQIRVQHADVSEEEALFEEQLSSYDLAAALTGNQELNLVKAVQAKLLGVKRSIALVIKTDYLRLARYMHIDVTVSLKDTVVRDILAITRRGSMATVHAIAEADLEILELTVDELSRLAGRSLRAAELPRESLVLYIIRSGATLLPEGNLTLQSGDRLGILTRKRFIRKLEARLSTRT